MTDFATLLQRYASLLVRFGANVQPGQVVQVSAEVHHRELAYLVGKEAYECGAKQVLLEMVEPRLLKHRLQRVDEQHLGFVPEHIPLKLKNLVDSGGATIKIVGPEFPLLYVDLDPRRVNQDRKAYYQAVRYFYEEGLDKSKVHWTMGAASTPEWARRVFPNLGPEEADRALWDALFKIARVENENFLDLWREHDDLIHRRAEWLSSLKVDSLHFTGPGTDLMVGLSPLAIFKGGSDLSPHGIRFEPNIPTEECFTAPDARRTSGVVSATRPFLINGVLIEGLRLTFREGEIVEFSARAGEEVFREYISTDAGAKRLGEVALVGIDSPVFQSGLVFEEILLDENAACHVAIGSAYKVCLEGGTALSRQELAEAGCNESLVHTDIMISSPEVDVTAVTRAGEKVALIRKGEWTKEVP